MIVDWNTLLRGSIDRNTEKLSSDLTFTIVISVVLLGTFVYRHLFHIESTVLCAIPYVDSRANAKDRLAGVTHPAHLYTHPVR